MLNNDFENYINYIKHKFDNENINVNELFTKFQTLAIDRLDKFKDSTVNNVLNLRGDDLKKFILSIQDLYKNIIIYFKNNKVIKNSIKDLLRLSTIVELSLCIDILNEIKDFNLSYTDIINNFKIKILNNELILTNQITEPLLKKRKIDAFQEESESSNDSCESDNENIMDYLYNENGSNDITEYYNNLNYDDKKYYINNIKEILNYYTDDDRPMIFKILDLPLDISYKNHIFKTYQSLLSSYLSDNKLSVWFDSLMTIPFGKYKGINLKSLDKNNIKSFLLNLENTMNNAVYGHDDAKRQIIQIIGQQIRNPEAKGSVLGIWGAKGNGKTSLIKEGIAKAMDKPFVFISLGGATDASFLEGHSYTYQGSIYGRIVDGLITAKCMDPIIYFDELDKISQTYKGEEITNLLIHLTDPIQNTHFRDKYFHGIDIDLSRATIIFSYNDPSQVNHILLDRITTIRTKSLLIPQKVHIASNYLIPNIMKDMGFNDNEINISSDIINYIIETYTLEGGVRKLKSLLYNIIRELNLKSLLDEFNLPYNVSLKDIKYFLKNKNEITGEKIHFRDKIGIINGLYAMSDGSYGGIIPIQILWMISSKPLEIKATGNLEKVILESTDVALTLAFNQLDKDKQCDLIKKLKQESKGLHIHCPSGGVSKDGPSAGTALTVAIYSILTNTKIRNDIAITGEITLEGKVTKIGGLDNKLEGAKKAGVRLVLFPYDNINDFNKIKEKNSLLFNNNFKAIPIKTITEALDYALI